MFKTNRPSNSSDGNLTVRVKRILVVERIRVGTILVFQRAIIIEYVEFTVLRASFNPRPARKPVKHRQWKEWLKWAIKIGRALMFFVSVIRVFLPNLWPF